MMFDDIIRFLLVFLFLLAPYAFVFYAVFGGQQVLHNDYESSPALCEHALLHCTISELKVPHDGNSESYRARGQFIFNGSLSGYQDEQCQRAKESCRLIEPSGFETFYSLLFSIFRIALVDDSKSYLSMFYLHRKTIHSIEALDAKKKNFRSFFIQQAVDSFCK